MNIADELRDIRFRIEQLVERLEKKSSDIDEYDTYTVRKFYASLLTNKLNAYKNKIGKYEVFISENGEDDYIETKIEVTDIGQTSSWSWHLTIWANLIETGILVGDDDGILYEETVLDESVVIEALWALMVGLCTEF